VLSEIIAAMVVMTITVAIVSFLVFMIFGDVIRYSDYGYEHSLQKESQMILEGDFFIRRISRLRRATNLRKDRHLIGFWESTSEERKYVFYHLELEGVGGRIKLLNRYAISREDIEKSYYRQEIINYIDGIENGIYCRPLNLFSPDNGVTRLLRNARFYAENNMYTIGTGMNKYYIT